MLKSFVMLFTISYSLLCCAEINVYKPTDNTGINKKEQIGEIEVYLSRLSTQLNGLEQKLDADALKIKNLEAALVQKDGDIKKLQDQVALKPNDTKTVSQKSEASAEDLEKIKADVLSIKNNDVEQLRVDVNGLRYSVKNLEKILKVPAN